MVTVNDYLSKRDSEWMGPLYMFHGQTVDCIDKHQPNSVERRKAYACDITAGYPPVLVQSLVAFDAYKVFAGCCKVAVHLCGGDLYGFVGCEAGVTT